MSASAPSDLCIIFDLDGTLVDSEALCQGGYLDLIPELNDSVEEMLTRYRGVNMEQILVDLEERIGRKLEEDFEPRYRARVAERLEAELQPIPGAREMLEKLEFPCCIASNGPLPKMQLSLRICEMDSHFGDRLFSAHDVKAWKPDPALFLHAAKEMGFPAEQCVVIEDSAVGLQGALAAEMITLYYDHGPEIDLPPSVISFDDMLDLPDILEDIATYKRRWSL